MADENLRIIAVLILAILLIFGLWKFAIYLKRCKIVKETSKLLEKLNKINEEMTFHSDVKTKYVQGIEMPSKPKYDRYSCEQLRDEILMDDIHPLHRALTQIEENHKEYDIFRKSQKAEINNYSG